MNLEDFLSSEAIDAVYQPVEQAQGFARNRVYRAGVLGTQLVIERLRAP